jgi:hypothetical protein
MSKTVFPLHHDDYRRSGPDDLVSLPGPPDQLPLILPRRKLEIVTLCILESTTLHLSGPTGSGKSTLIEYVSNPRNFHAVLHGMGRESSKAPLLYPIQMATFDSPSELYSRRALRGGETFDEDSILVKALKDAVQRTDCHPVLWLREMGRVASAQIQGALLDLITPHPILLPDGCRIQVNACWIADSNYQAEHDATHTLVPFDEALKRRFSHQVTLPWLPPEQEAEVLRHLLSQRLTSEQRRGMSEETLAKTVKLGASIRARKAEGVLTTLVPPTIYSYLAFLELLARSDWSVWDAACCTLLGNASQQDAKLLPAVFNEAFGLEVAPDEMAESTAGSLF